MIDFHLHARKKRGWTLKILRLYDRAGVHRAVTFGLGDALGEMTNPEVLALCLKHPDRLIPFAHVRLGRDTARTVKSLAEEGFRGLKAIWPIAPYDDKRFWPLYEEAARLALPILFHTGIVLRSKVDERQPVSSLWMRPGTLDLVARRFPKLKIVAAHLGGPWFDEAFMISRVHPNVWLDVSSGSGWRSKGMNARYFGEKLGWWNGFVKLIFATDQPHTKLSPADAVREWKGILAAARASQSTQKRFWSANASEILNMKFLVVLGFWIFLL